MGQPRTLCPPGMETVKRTFMSWLLEGQEKEAVVNFQHLIREAVSMGKGQGNPQSYHADRKEGQKG